jgi:hypothetical protein
MRNGLYPDPDVRKFRARVILGFLVLTAGNARDCGVAIGLFMTQELVAPQSRFTFSNSVNARLNATASPYCLIETNISAASAFILSLPTKRGVT